MQKLRLITIVAAMITMVVPRIAHACAMCGLPAGDHQTHAFNTSVLFMMLVPYSICLVGAAVGFFAYRNAQKRRALEMRSGLGPEHISE